MYISMYVYIYIYTYIYTSTRALTRLVPVTTRVATVSNDFVWRLPGAHQPAFWVPIAHLRFLVWRFNRLAFGPGCVFPRSREKQDHDLRSHMVPEVMRNGPGYTSTKESWSQEWWEMVPTSIWMSIPIHRFIDPVDPSRSISTVDKESPTGEYGRYRRSIRIHLRRIAVNVEKGLGLPISPFSCQSAFRRSRPQLKLGEEIDSSRLVDDYACKNQRYQTPPQG